MTDTSVEYTHHQSYKTGDGWIGFNGSLSMQAAAISRLKAFKFVTKANGIYKMIHLAV